MNFVLVPFLLAVRVPPNEDWTNGPEYTFDVRVNTTSFVQRRFLQDHPEGARNSSLLYKLTCRPEEPDGLICRMNETRARASENGSSTLAESVPFEIRFNVDGNIDNYAVLDDGELATCLTLNTYRAIANQLSVGVNLRDKGESFSAMESFTVGDCPVDYVIRRKKVVQTEEESATRRNGTFALTYLTDLEMRDDEVTNITRRRRVVDCLSYPPYVFHTKHTYGLVPGNVVGKIRASDTCMLISKRSFSSVTVNRFQLYNNEDEEEDVGSILEYISLCLESVRPAESKLERLESATIKFGIVADTIGS